MDALIRGETLVYSFLTEDGNALIPNNVNIIGKGAFSANPEIVSLDIPVWVKRIENRAFAKCHELRSVHIPPTVEYVGDGAFADCEKLERVECDLSKTSFGKDCFSRCRSLKWLKNGEEQARVFYFSKPDRFSVAFPYKEISSNGNLYRAKEIYQNFPVFERPEANPVYFAVYEDDGEEYRWYSMNEYDAIQGAYMQFTGRTYLQSFGRLGLDTEITPRQLAMIVGFCDCGTEAYCKRINRGFNDRMTIKEILDFLSHAAPGAFRRLVYVLQHQDEIDQTKKDENFLLDEEIFSSEVPSGNRLVYSGKI